MCIRDRGSFSWEASFFAAVKDSGALVEDKPDTSMVGISLVSGGCDAEEMISLTAASRATRLANSGVAVSSIGTTTAPRRRQPQKATSHSAELGAQRRTRSLVRMPRDFSSRAKFAACCRSFS